MATPPERRVRSTARTAVNGSRWVIDGDYSALLPQRLARATGLILLDASAGASLTRYVKLTISTHDRIGGLDGNTDKLSWEMFRYILTTGQANRRKYRQLFEELTLPKIFIPNRQVLDRFYRQQNLIVR